MFSISFGMFRCLVSQKHAKTGRCHKIVKDTISVHCGAKSNLAPWADFVIYRYTLVMPSRLFQFSASDSLPRIPAISTHCQLIFQHGCAACAMCTVDAVVPPGPVFLECCPHRRRRCRLEVHLRARLSCSSDPRRHETT